MEPPTIQSALGNEMGKLKWMGVSLGWAQLRSLLTIFGTPSIWKVLTILFYLLNLKSLWGAWHIRIISAYFRHIAFPYLRLNPQTGPASLFRPMIISSHTPLLECDYNFHKSNSTYFLDFDHARMHLCAGLLGPGLARTSKELGSLVNIVLAGVSCNFKREIKPYQSFEIWSRILCWDRKWLYTISHFVKKGSVRPRRTFWLWGTTRKEKPRAAEKRPNITRDESGVTASQEATSSSPSVHPAIFASAIAKYVFKHGRLTVTPEKILQNSNLLPPKPIDTPPPNSSTPSNAAVTDLPTMSIKTADEIIEASLTADTSSTGKPKNAEDVWDWDRIQTERMRGMKIAELYAGLEALNQEFSYEGKPLLGEVVAGGWLGIR